MIGSWRSTISRKVTALIDYPGSGNDAEASITHAQADHEELACTWLRAIPLSLL